MFFFSFEPRTVCVCAHAHVCTRTISIWRYLLERFESNAALMPQPNSKKAYRFLNSLLLLSHFSFYFIDFGTSTSSGGLFGTTNTTSNPFGSTSGSLFGPSSFTAAPTGTTIKFNVSIFQSLWSIFVSCIFFCRMSYKISSLSSYA